MPGSGLGFAVLEILVFALASALFFYSFYVKIMLIRTGAPEVVPRWNNIPGRVKLVLYEVVGHLKHWRDSYAGPMHFAIFYGFMFLFLSIVNFFWEGLGFSQGRWEKLGLGFIGKYVNGLALPFTEGFFWYHALMNLFFAAVLIALAMAFYRRLIMRPERMELTKEALLILTLIAGVIITDIMLESAKVVREGEPFRGAFVSNAFAHLWKGVGVKGEHAGGIAYAVSWWLHAAILLGFLNYLPISKHMHILLAVPNIFMQSLEPKGSVPPIPGLEEREKWGAHTIPELSWKALMDGLTCQECGRCQQQCPAYNTKKPLSPKKIHLDIKHLLVEEGFVEEGKERQPIISDKWTKPEEIWSCTTCRACMTECPVGNEHIPKIIEYRRYLTLMEGNIASEAQLTLQNLEKNSNPWGVGFDQRGKWAEGLDVPVFAEGAQAEYCYYVGCAGSFDDRYKKVSTNFVKILKKAGVSFAILGVEEGCCGDTARRLGNEYLFKIMVEQNIQTFNNYKIKKFITTCPHGYNALKNEYRQFGFQPEEVIHHTEFIDRLLKQGKLKLNKPLEANAITYHDSCYLGRHNDIYDPPRDIIRAVPGAELKEMPRHLFRSFCCGAGGGLMWLEEHAERMNFNRAKEAVATGAKTIAVACPFCMTMLEDGVKNEKKEESVKTMDITEIVARAMGEV